MTGRDGEQRLLLMFAAGAALTFLACVQMALLLPIGPQPAYARLDAGEIISLASGMVTSAGLVAIFLQFRQAREMARKAAADAAEQRRQEARSAALRADRLHAEWNTEFMHRQRELAWRYFDHLDDRGWRRLARSWVLSLGVPGIPPVKSRIQQSIMDFPDYNWAMTSIVAFFVRLESHLQIYHADEELRPEEVSSLTGPFFWTYWRPYLIRLVNACEEVSRTATETGDGPTPADIQERTYFVRPMRRLFQLTHVAAPAPGAHSPQPDQQAPAAL